MALANDAEKRLLLGELLSSLLHTDEIRTSDKNGTSALASIQRWFRGPTVGSDDARCRSALLRLWHHIPLKGQELALASRAGAWATTIESAIDAGDQIPTPALAAFLKAAPWPTFSRAASMLVEHGEPAEVRRAERSLVRMATLVAPPCSVRLIDEEFGLPRYEAPSASPRVTDAVRRDFACDLADLAWRYDVHRRATPVFLCLLLLDDRLRNDRLGEQAERIARLLAPSSHPAHAAALRVLRRSKSAGMRRRAWRWTAIESVARSAVERLAHSRGGADDAALLDDAHLALRPKRAHAAAVVPIHIDETPSGKQLRPGAVLPHPNDAGGLRVPSRLGYVRLCGVFDVPGEIARGMTAPFVVDPDPRVRLAAMRTVNGPEQCDYVFDADPHVARSATRRWSRRDTATAVAYPHRGSEAERARLSELMARSEHESVREAARRERLALDPWSPEDPASRSLARRFHRRDASRFLAEAHARLASDDAELILSTIQVCRTVGVADAISAPLIRLASTDPASIERGEVVVATAVAALEASYSQTVTAALIDATGAEDARVRANAVESLVYRRGVEPRAAIIEAKRDPHHRVRTSAAVAWLRSGAATHDDVHDVCVDLVTLLECDDARARGAAAWAAQRVLSRVSRDQLRTAAGDLARGVIRRAGDEPCERARARLQAAARRFTERYERVRSFA